MKRMEGWSYSVYSMLKGEMVFATLAYFSLEQEMGMLYEYTVRMVRFYVHKEDLYGFHIEQEGKIVFFET